MTYAKKKLFINLVKFYGILALLFTISVGIFWRLSSITPASRLPILITGIFYFFIGFFSYPLYIKMQDKLDEVADDLFDKINSAKLGVDGEKEVCSKLEGFLNQENYTIHKNVLLPDHKFDIDTIVVGPKGIFVFEIKNYTSQMHFRGEQSFIEIGGELKLVSENRDPRISLNRYCYFLSKYLVYKGLNGIYLNKAVVFPKNNSAILQKGSKVGVFIISGVDSLKPFFERLSDHPRFTPEFCKKINNTLNKLKK